MSIEAMLSILAFLSVLGLFLSAAAEQSQKAAESVSSFKALAEAQKCSLLIDSVFSNSGAMPDALDIECFQKEKGRISAKSDSAEASAIVLAPEVYLNQDGAVTTLEVKTNAHYK